VHREEAGAGVIPVPGNEATFGALVRPHLARLHALALVILGSDDDARDALQEALAHAWQGLSRHRDPSVLESSATPGTLVKPRLGPLAASTN
jgi:DNA-directed RNA polymerase specialized sigma24 family protein